MITELMSALGLLDEDGYTPQLGKKFKDPVTRAEFRLTSFEQESDGGIAIFEGEFDGSTRTVRIQFLED
jgi:hypothetical protein